MVTTMEGEPYTVFDRSLLAAAPGMHEVRSFESLMMMAGAEDGIASCLVKVGLLLPRIESELLL